MSVFGVILVCIFPHWHWIRRDTPYLSVFRPNSGKYGPEQLRIWTLFTQCKSLAHFWPIFSFQMLPVGIEREQLLEKGSFISLIRDHRYAVTLHEIWKRIQISVKLYHGAFYKKTFCLNARWQWKVIHT